MKKNHHIGQSQKILYYLVILAVLLSQWQLTSDNTGYNFDIRGWYFPAGLIVLTLTLVNRIYIPKKPLELFVAITIISLLLIIAIRGTNFLSTLAQAVVFAAILVIAYSIINVLGHELLNAALLKAAMIIAISVICHEFLYLLNPAVAELIFGNFNTEKVSIFIRARGLLGEPSWGGIFLGPLVYVALQTKSRTKHFILTVGSILTFSLLTYIALALSYFLYYLSVARITKKNILSAIALLLVVAIGFKSDAIAGRLDQFFYASGSFSSEGYTISEYNEMAGSVATLTFNSLIAMEALRATHGIGVGFGNFREAYSEFSPNYLPPGYTGVGLFYNQLGGGSLWIRVATELGIAGLIVLFSLHYYAIKRFIKIARENITQDARMRINYLSTVGLGIIVMAVYCIRKDAWINLFFCLSIVMAFSRKTLNKG